MGMFGGKIMELFGGAAPVAAQPANTTAAIVNANQTIPNDTTPKADGTVAGLPAVDPNKSPMADYTNVWDKSKDKALPNPTPTFTIDQADLLTKAKGIDFGKHINQEALGKASKGDSEALLQVLNEATQAGFAYGTQGQATLLEQALAKQAKTFQEEYFPEMMRRHDASREVAANNTAFNDPAIAPITDILKERFAAQYPNASPAQIAEHTRKFMTGMSKTITAGEKSGTSEVVAEVARSREIAAKTKGGKNDDWTTFFDPGTA